MLGSIISAGASLLGGLLGKSSQEKQAEQNIRLQKQFAQEGIQWKVEDAKKAGIHPLYALGAQTHSFAPVSVGDTISPALASAGQDIGRAIDATRSTSGKLDAYAKTVQALNLERMGLENQILGAQLAKTRQVGSAPPMPTAGDRYLMDGQSESGLINTSPMARQAVAPEATSQEAGAVADLGFTKTSPGRSP